MGALVFEINGVDFKPYLKLEGLSPKRNDVDSADAGEMADGTLRRDRVIMRRTIPCQLRENLLLNEQEMKKLQQALWPQFVPVKYNEPLLGKVVTRTFYTNNITTQIYGERNGELLYKGFSFDLIEQGDPKAMLEYDRG